MERPFGDAGFVRKNVGLEVTPAMFDMKWSAAEKKIARQAYDAALERSLGKLLADFRQKAAAIGDPRELWDIEEFLRNERQRLDEIFDYRYSRLPMVFAQLIREGHLTEGELAGLSGEKLDVIRHIVSR